MAFEHLFDVAHKYCFGFDALYLPKRYSRLLHSLGALIPHLTSLVALAGEENAAGFLRRRFAVSSIYSSKELVAVVL